MKHLDYGQIQAFLDGELKGNALAEASVHFAICDECTAAMLEAEAESSAIDFAFSAEKSLGVPTQRIWARIENEIEVIKTEQKSAPTPLWNRLGAFFTFGEFFSFTPMQIFAYGSTLAAVVLVSLFTLSVIQNQNSNVSPEVAAVQTPEIVPAQTTNSPKIVPITSSGTPAVAPTENPKTVELPKRNVAEPSYQVIKANYKAEAPRPRTENRKPGFGKPGVPFDAEMPLAEERQYIDAIDDLKKTVATNDELMNRPSFRVEFEQNVAAMDQVIAKMQRAVRKNPKDQNAKRLLFSSYQNKIDMLNTVAEKTTLMATLQ